MIRLRPYSSYLLYGIMPGEPLYQKFSLNLDEEREDAHMHKDILTTIRHRPRSSLQEISIAKVSASLCNNPQLLALILNCELRKDIFFRMCVNDREWKAVMAKANELAFQVCKSVLLKKKMLEFICKASYRIMVWKSVYAPTIENRLLQYFDWTDRGKIDTRRTARQIIENKSIPFLERFVLGCRVCLGEELREMWNEASNTDKELIFSPNNGELRPLLLFWGYSLEGFQHHREEYINPALNYAVKSGMLEAVKYLLPMCREYKASFCIDMLNQKLHKENHLEEEEYDMAFFLFFKMDEYDQQVYFHLYPQFFFSLLIYSSEYELGLTFLKERVRLSANFQFFKYVAIIYLAYHFEFSNNGACSQLFIDVWQLLPTSVRNYLSDSRLFIMILAILIRDYFPFVLEKNALKKVGELTSLDSNSSSYVEPFDFNKGKWEFLQFIVKEEITTIRLLKMNKKTILKYLRKRQSNRTAWSRFLAMIMYIKKENP